jgi:hypothetical protein
MSIQIVYANWMFVMEKTKIDLNVPPSKSKEQLWKAMKQAVHVENNGIDDYRKESFDFMNDLRLYKQKYPGMGGDSHDLSKWSKAERSEYSFNHFRSDRDF